MNRRPAGTPLKQDGWLNPGHDNQRALTALGHKRRAFQSSTTLGAPVRTKLRTRT